MSLMSFETAFRYVHFRVCVHYAMSHLMMRRWSIADTVQSGVRLKNLSFSPQSRAGCSLQYAFLFATQSRCVYISTTVYFVAGCLLYHKACYCVAMQQKKTTRTLLGVWFPHLFLFFLNTKLCSISTSAIIRTMFHGALKDKHSSRKTPCREYKLSVVALTSAAHNESLKCERLKMQKDRRRPDTCHPFHPEVSLTQRENSPSCFTLFNEIPPTHFAPPICLYPPLSLGELNGVRWSYKSHPVSCGNSALRPPDTAPQVTRAGPSSPSWTWIGSAWLGMQRCHRKQVPSPYNACPIPTNHLHSP